MGAAQGEMFAEQPKSQAVTVEGTVRKVVYQNSEGFQVLRVDVEGELHTWVGQMPDFTEGTPVKAIGEWVQDARHGRQLRVGSVFPVEPTTPAGIADFLGSGLVPGIGPKLAEKIVAKFGEKTLEVLEQEPHRLAAEVPRMSQKKAAALAAAWAEHKAVGQVMIWLHAHGVPGGLARRIYDRYGARSIDEVSTHPYKLAIVISGVGFKTADELARRLGVGHDSLARVMAGVLHVLQENAGDGHCFMPGAELMEHAAELLECAAPRILEGIEELRREGRVVHDGAVDGFYLAREYEAEVRVAARLRELLASPATRRGGESAPPLEERLEAVIQAYEREAKVELAPAQREAVRAVARHKVLVITGGPGVGKTTIVKAILRVFDAAHLRVALGAPTGRAAKRMSEATGRGAMTIHRLLDYDAKSRRFQACRAHPLGDDVVIIDETSMLDIHLADSVLDAVRDGARLVLVGDVDQLPSVGPGAVLRDVIESGVVPTVRLTTIFRQAAGSLIIENAHRINAGEPPCTGPHGRSDFHVIERTAVADAANTIVELVATRIPAAYGFDPRTEIQVLTPMRKTEAGVDALNLRLQEALNPPRHGVAETKLGKATVYRVGDRVMQTKNDYDRDVYNGDVGRIIEVYPDAEKKEPRVIVDIDGRPVAYNEAQLRNLVLAYAMSIHKSQGGQMPAVVIPVSKSHYVMLSRNLVYTAVTRGAKLVILVSDPAAMKTALAETRRELRHTRLAKRLASSEG